MGAVQVLVSKVQDNMWLSNITLNFMSISLTLICMTYVYAVCRNEKKHAVLKHMAWIVRIMMTAALLFEFMHDLVVDPMLGECIHYEETSASMINMILFGYVPVMAICNVFSLGMKDFDKRLHLFDMTVASMPALISVIYYILPKVSGRNASIDLVACYAVLLLISYMQIRFICHGKRGLGVWILASSICGTIAGLKVNNRMMLPTFVFSIVMIVFEAARNASSSTAMGKMLGNAKACRYVAIIFIVLLFFMCNPFANIWNMTCGYREFTVSSVQRENAMMCSTEKAEATARKAIDNKNAPLKMHHRDTDDFHKVYNFISGDYLIDVDGITGKLIEIRYIGKSMNDVSSKANLSNDEVRKKTITFLQKNDFKYDSSKVDMRIREEGNCCYVDFYHKFSDGSIVEKDYPFATICWFNNGMIKRFSPNGAIFDMTDYAPFIKMNDEKVGNVVQEFFQRLGRSVPKTVPVSFAGNFDGNNTMNVMGSDGSMVSIDTGRMNVKSYRKSDAVLSKSKDVGEAAAREYAKRFSCYYMPDAFKGIRKSDGYLFRATSTNYCKYIDTAFDSDGNLYQINSSIAPVNENKYLSSDFNVCSYDAMRKVIKRYKPFGVYSCRVKLVSTIGKHERGRLKWMVVILPYRSKDHHVYFVDVNNGRVKMLKDTGDKLTCDSLEK